MHPRAFFHPHPLAATCALLFLSASVHASEQESVASLPTIEIKGQTTRGAAAAYSSTELTTQDFQDAHISHPQDLLRKVPGMNVQNYNLSGVGDAIVMRGFGGGGHGGDIGVVLDGIPLNEAMSHADGYVDLNVIVPLEIQRLTVYKGPVSALYGNFNRAGLMAIETRKSEQYKEADLSLSSHATLDAQAAFGLKIDEGEHLNLAAQHYRTKGWRTQSDHDRTTLAARWSKQVSGDLEIAVSGRLHHSEGDSPGYLTGAQFATDPYGKDPRAMNDGAKKDFATLRADARYSLAPELTWLSFAYTTRQSFTRWFSRPVSTTAWRQREENYDRAVYGAGTSLNGSHQTSLTPLKWVAGIEAFRESTDYEYFDGLDRRARVNPAISDRTSRLNSVSAFGEIDAPIHPLLQVSAGMRWDRFTGDCERNGAETGSDPCGALNRVSHGSPKFGVRSQVAPGVLFRTSWSEGFALPSTFAKYALGAASLSPNVFRQTEVGVQLKPFADLVVDLAAYRMISSDEIRNVAPGVYENYGRTRRTGVEMSALWAAHRNIDLQLAWGSAHSRVLENGNAALIGNRVAGVPRTTTTFGATWRPAPAWETTLTWRRVGRYAVNDANAAFHNGFATWDLGLSHDLPMNGLRLYALVSNLTDKVHATSSSMIGGMQLYTPGAPRTFKVGVHARF
ncbi:TonB-dependent receptor [Diaphorobacter caeni]|uniref:TonB-dependent receptor n=1 Tax=Diaphorobacter caeni TaxID=2784387 RepID=UPI00188FE42F|nr:TonB-dependent receptor [Diaphorobacter caeni]MBF5003077.1 TonB-dependent receptor [Diaphorobacter caeni]